jgi:hypothetical protein
MDKASVLAATITYIHELQERVKNLEDINLSLKNQLLGAEQDQRGTVGKLISPKVRGSPSRRGLRTSNSLSPTDENKIQVSPGGDGNLTIEIKYPCTQPDIVIHIFACLKQLQMKVENCDVNSNDSRIHANLIVKVSFPFFFRCRFDHTAFPARRFT